MKNAVVLVYRGAPNEPTLESVQAFLENIRDDRAIGGGLLQKIMRTSAELPSVESLQKKYAAIWTDYGSPVLANLISIAEKLGTKLQKEALVMPTLRFGMPSLRMTLRSLKAMEIRNVYLLPLYPQLCRGDFLGLQKYVEAESRKIAFEAEIDMLDMFHSDDSLIRIYGDYLRAKKNATTVADTFLISFPAAPEDTAADLADESYRALCAKKMRLLADAAGIARDKCQLILEKPVLGGDSGSAHHNWSADLDSSKKYVHLSASTVLDDVDACRDKLSYIEYLESVNDSDILVHGLSDKLSQIFRDKQ